MSKRIKKKRELEQRVRVAESMIDFLIKQNNQIWDGKNQFRKCGSDQ